MQTYKVKKLIIILLAAAAAAALIISVLPRKAGEEYSFETVTGENAVTACMDSSLIVVTGSGAVLYSAQGETLDGFKMSCGTPMAYARGEYACAYDVSGTQCAVFSQEKLLYTVETEKEIISCTVSSTGRLAICARERGRDGAVTVYSENGKAIYKLYCGTAYPVAADVAPDGEILAVALAGESGCRADIYDMHYTQPAASFDFDTHIPADIRWMNDDRLFLQCADIMYLVDGNGTEIGRMELSQNTLTGLAFDDNGISVVFKHTSGTEKWELISFDTDMKIIAAIETDREIMSVSRCAGNILAVFAQNAVVYKEKLKAVQTFALGERIGRAWLRGDGSCALAGQGIVYVIG